MRLALVLLLLVAASCRAPYLSDLADMTVWPVDLPPTGTGAEALEDWFQAEGYAPGPRVRQAEAELRRRPGDPLIYAHAEDKLWWQTRVRTVRDFCVTERVIYYRVTPGGALAQAIEGFRSQC